MSKSRLDKYEGRYAARVGDMRSSAIRDLMSLTARPEVISLAGGMPATECFPGEVFDRINLHIGANKRALSLQYGPTEGFDFVKDDIAVLLAEEDTAIDPARVLITTGAQQGIDLVTKTFVDPGDIVLAEGPTYAGALATFSTYQADVRHLPMDGDGLVVEELENVLAELEIEGRRPKFLYVVPNFSNPGGTTLSLERRKRLVELAAEKELLVIEDNPYGLLRFAGEPVSTLLSLDRAENVVYLGSFSKIISPGIRTGYLIAPPAIYQKMVFGKQATDLCSSPLNQLFVHEFISSGAWVEYVQRQRSLYLSRRDAMLAALRKEFPPGSTWTVPQGGFFVWATLPEPVHTGDLLVKAIEENVAFVGGAGFFTDGRGTSSMRLSFSGQSEERIREGICRLGGVIREQMGLYEALGFSGRQGKSVDRDGGS
ncbi:MAG TPA: PLP-dependent aminotransferase family protein [Thermoleophilia bacterium]